MRVFLCDFGDFSVAIPMRSVSSLIFHTADVAQEDSVEECNNYVSLPGLLNMPSKKIRHGIILKNYEEEGMNTIGNKTILLAPEVESELEIPDEEVFPIPGALNNTGFSQLFSGIKFDSRKAAARGGCPILLLKSRHFIKKEKAP